jgi:hypothetical protein
MDGELWLPAVRGDDAAAGLTLLALPALVAPTYTVTDLGTLGEQTATATASTPAGR